MNVRECIQEAKRQGITMEQCEKNMHDRAMQLGKRLTESIMRTQTLFSFDEIATEAKELNKFYRDYIDLFLGQKLSWEEI